MNKSRFILAMILVLAMLFTTMVPSVAVTDNNRSVRTSRTFSPNERRTQSINEKKLESLKNLKQETSRFDRFNVDENAEVTVIVTFAEDATIKGFSDINSKAAQDKRAMLKVKQDSFVAGLSFEAELKQNYTVLFNGVAITTAYKNVTALEGMKGVTGVYLSNTYEQPEEMPQMDFANTITGAATLHDMGFRGDGLVVAVLDTGLTLGHEAFKDYGTIDNAVLTEAGVAAVDTEKEGAYLSSKVPFAYDYYDMDADVSDNNGHGTHVAGIATGYVEDADGAISFSGAAPDAQLLAMKVFSSDPENGGTNSSIYFAALEDAYLLGADVINMSLGSPGGFTYDVELENELYGNVYKTLDDAGVIVCISAGNEYSMGYNALNHSGAEAVLPDYADYGTVGSPSTYAGNMSVASVENTSYPAYCIMMGEEIIPYSDSCEDGEHGFLDTFKETEVQYVVVPGLGAAADYTDIDVTGKLALVQRGENTFEEKVENADNAGAIGVIIYNNQPGQIGLLIETYEVPAVAIEQKQGELLAAVTGGVGTISVPSEKQIIANANAGKMSDFSGWGTTSDLKLKPQITAPGGMIYSSVNGGAPGDPFMLGDVNRDDGIDSADAATILRHIVKLATINEEDLFYGDVDQNDNTDAADAAAILRYIVRLQELPMYTPNNGSLYDVYSGTSMASPNAAGSIAAILELVKEVSPDMTKKEQADFTENLLYSTAEILTDEDDSPYSPRKQGTGELSLDNAKRTNVYITNPIVELGDDLEKTGVYSFSLELKNVGNDEETYTITQSSLFDYTVSPKNEAEYNYYNLLMSDVLDAELLTNFENNTVVVPANDTVEVQVTLTLTEDQKEVFEERFANGTFVEGFIEFVPLRTSMTAIHATFLAFYGDWTQGPILETYDYSDVANAEVFLNTAVADDDGNTLADLGYVASDALEMNIGFNEAYTYGLNTGEELIGYLGDNPIGYVEHSKGRNAISNETSDSYYLADLMLTYPTQLRNARHLIMVVTDDATGEIYYVDDTEYLPKAAYDADYDMYMQNGEFYWDGTDTEGAYVPSGTQVTVNYYAWLDYDTEAEAALNAADGDYSLLSDDYLAWQIPLTIDTTAPTVTLDNWDAAMQTVTVTATDESFLAGILLYDAEYNLIKSVAFASIEADSLQYAFDLTGIEGDTVIISPIDYATNWPDFIFNKTTGELVEATPATFTPINDICTDISLEDTAESYTTRGVVTLVDGKSVYIESLMDDQTETDLYNGICIYLAEAPTDTNPGDVIVATGVPTVYNGLYELKDATIDDVLYVEEGDWNYWWSWDPMPIADVVEYSSELACTPIGYGMNPETYDDDVTYGLTIVSIAANSAAGYWNIVVTDGETEMTIYKCPTPLEGIEKFVPGAIIAGYLVVGIYNAPQFRVALPEDIWVIQESSETPTPTPTPSEDPSGLPYFTNELTNNGSEFMVGQTVETVLSADGSPNPAKATIYNSESISVTPWHGIGSFNVDTAYTYIYFTADLTEQTGVKFAGSFSGNGRVPTAFKAEYKIGEGEYVSLGDIALEHAAGVAPTAAVNWSFDVPAACEGQAAVTFRVKQTASATAKADGSSTSDAGALYISGVGLTTGAAPTPPPSTDPTPTPSEEPTPTPPSGSGLTEGNYYISTQVGGVTYYMTNTVVNNKFSSTTDMTAAAVWTVAASGTGYTLANGGQYVAYSGTASSGKTNINLGDTAEVWTWDSANSRLLSTSVADRALAANGGNGNVFGNYALSNASSASYGFTITLTPAA